MTDFVKHIRKIVLNAIHAEKLTDVIYGEVIKAAPLEIQVEQKLVLTEDHLKLTNTVRNYDTEISINGGIKQPCTIYNALKKGDKVTMIRVHGGQDYIVIDKEG